MGVTNPRIKRISQVSGVPDDALAVMVQAQSEAVLNDLFTKRSLRITEHPQTAGGSARRAPSAVA